MYKFDLKKYLIRQSILCRYACSYVYAYAPGFDVPYRFFFEPWHNRKMWMLVRQLRARSFRVVVWRPE